MGGNWGLPRPAAVFFKLFPATYANYRHYGSSKLRQHCMCRRGRGGGGGWKMDVQFSVKLYDKSHGTKGTTGNGK